MNPDYLAIKEKKFLSFVMSSLAAKLKKKQTWNILKVC